MAVGRFSALAYLNSSDQCRLLLKARRVAQVKRVAEEAARTRPLPPEQISPVARFVDSALAAEIAATPSPRFFRRGLMFLAAIRTQRVDRVSSELHAEAQRLNRGERLLAMLGRPLLDPRQTALAFMQSLPEHLANDWTLLLHNSE